MRRRASLIVLAVYLAALATVVLWPTRPGDAERAWKQVRRLGVVYSYTLETVIDVMVNVLIFVPVGFLLSIALGSGRRGAVRGFAVAAALALALEAGQWAAGWRKP